MDCLTQTKTVASMAHAITKSIDDFENDLKQMVEEFLPSESASVEEVTEDLCKIFYLEKKAHVGSVNLGDMATVSRWCMGHCLLHIKRELGHGNYGPWLEKNQERLGFTQRSAENYTKLAKAHETLEALVESLRAEPDTEDETGEELPESEVDPSEIKSACPDSRPTKVEGVLKGCTALQKSIRYLVESDEELSSADLAQIKSVRRELDELLERVEGGCDDDHTE